MAEREGIIFTIILYLLIASTFCGLVNNQDINLLSDFDDSYTDQVVINSNTSMDNIDYTVVTYNCDYTLDALGLHTVGAGTDSNIKVSFPVLSGESKGSYEYTFTKDTNDKIVMQFYDTALSNVESYVLIQNDNIYYTKITIDPAFGQLIYSGVGNTFAFTVEFDEDQNWWKYYLNGELIYVYQSTTFPIIDLFSNIKNDIYLYTDTTSITIFEQSETEIKTTLSPLGDFTRYTSAILKILVWNLDGLPWIVNIIFIKFPEFILGMYVVLSAKGS